MVFKHKLTDTELASRKWQFRVDSLHIWPYGGRWINEATDKRGRINTLSMRQLIARELPGTARSETGRRPDLAHHGSELSDDAADRNTIELRQSLIQLAAAVEKWRKETHKTARITVTES
jgi:hypothetical protein